MFFFSGVHFCDMLITIFSYFNDTRVKRSEVRCRSACRGILILGFARYLWGRAITCPLMCVMDENPARDCKTRES